jgi:hypothetical protein
VSPSPSPQNRIAVLALFAAVKYAKDEEGEARFAACWTKDAGLEIESNGRSFALVEGREAIMAFYRQVWANGGHGKGSSRETHIAEHPDVTFIDDGRLLARHATSFFYAEDEEILIKRFGTFRDVIACADGAWRIVERQAILVRRD